MNSKIKCFLRFSILNMQKLIFHIFIILVLFFVPTNLFTQVINGTIEFEGRTREYTLFLPMDYETLDSLPLVMNLHGSYSGFNGPWQMNYTRMNTVADTAGFIVVYPSGIFEDGTYGGWYSDVEDPVNGVGFIDALLDTLSDLYKINHNQIYSCGNSAGGSMSFKLASELPHRITAIATNAGGINGGVMTNIELTRPIPLLCIHGTMDNYKAATITLEFWNNLNICSKTATIAIPDINKEDNCTVEKIIYANLGAGCEVVHYKVINGGHTWPGSAYDIPAVGNTNRDISANAEIWNFFKQYKLSELSFPDHDITPRLLIYDLKTLPMFINLKPPVLIQNGGLNDESEIPATFKIDSSGMIVYESTRIINDMKSMEKRNVIFDTSHTLYEGHYDIMCYSLLADDKNVKNDTLKNKIIITNIIDDFESGHDNQWISDYGWGVQEARAHANSGKYVFYSKGNASYKNSDTTTAIFFQSFNLSSLEIAYISFSTKYIFNDGDTGYVEVSIDHGQSWIRIGDAFTGEQSEHKLSVISLPLDSYSKADLKELMMRFKVINNPDNDFPRWYIDDVMLHPDEKPSIAEEIKRSNINKTHFVLYKNYPNPFNPITKISYSLLQSDFIILKIYNILGQEIQTLVNEYQRAGDYTIRFDAKNLSSGIYFYKLQAGSKKVQTKKMILMR